MDLLELTSAPDLPLCLRSWEKALGLRLSVLDQGGIFHTPAAMKLLGREHLGHQHQGICRAAADPERCTRHCRHSILPRAEKATQAFSHRCWVGVGELVLPLRAGGRFLGALFVGAWRATPRTTAPHGHPQSVEIRRAWGTMAWAEKRRLLAMGSGFELLAVGLAEVLQRALPGQGNEGTTKEKIRGYIRSHLGAGVPLAALASVLALSPSRTSHKVRELFGESLRDLVKRERFRQAQFDLETSDVGLEELARRLGMANARHFGKAFRSWAGKSPALWRRERWRPGY